MKKILSFSIISFLLIFALCINSLALTTSDNAATDLLGRKSLLMTVEIENRDYFSDKMNLISILNEETDLSGDLCYRNVEVIYGASDKTNSDSAIILLELTIYGTTNIDTIKSALAQCEGVKSVETDGTIQLDTVTVKGDVNCDGVITSADARLALRYSVGLEPQLTQEQILACDIDDNGTVSAADARLILRMSVGLS